MLSGATLDPQQHDGRAEGARRQKALTRAWAVRESRNRLADEKLHHFRGRRLDTAGDGVFAAFDGPARAVRCGVALAAGVESHGVQIRVGVHTGECAVPGEKYSSIAVHRGARRISGGTRRDLLSSTVKDLFVGSGLLFEDLGPRTLKGMPDQWRLYGVA